MQLECPKCHEDISVREIFDSLMLYKCHKCGSHCRILYDEVIDYEARDEYQYWRMEIVE